MALSIGSADLRASKAEKLFQESHGRGVPRQLRYERPSSLDLVFTAFRTVEENRTLQWFVEIFDRTASTFEQKVLGVERISTVEPDNTKPGDLRTDKRLFSQANVNTGVPSSFKVEVAAKTNSPLNAEEIWRAALDMMWELTDYPLQGTWLDRSFQSPLGGTMIYLTHNSFGKDPSHLTTQRIIWGLNHLMLSMTISKRYCQTLASMKWEGVPIGAIHIVRWIDLDSTRDSKKNGTALMVPDHPETRLSHFFDRDVSIRGAVYGDKPIERFLVYFTGMKALGEAAEKGLDTPITLTTTRGIQDVWWKLVRDRDARTRELKAGHSRVAVFRTLAKMVHDEKFREIYIILDVVGEKAATGGFNQGRIGAALS
ncbi:MAG: hypothetical protein Q9166_006607 [cf. Caloplaca sp. 2 TL-2023]